MKHIMLFALALLLPLSVFACAKKTANDPGTPVVIEEQTDPDPAGLPAVGGWQTTDIPEKEAAGAFEKVMDKLVGVKYTLLKCLGTQLAAGNNYCFLCRAQAVTPEAVPYYALVYVYENLEGTAEATDIMRLDIAATSENETWVLTDEAAQALMGGWFAADSEELTDELRGVFDKALEKLVGVSYEPELYLGSQVVAGRNHCFLCRSAVIYPGALSYYTLVYIYEDLQGGASILNISKADLGEMIPAE